MLILLNASNNKTLRTEIIPSSPSHSVRRGPSPRRAPGRGISYREREISRNWLTYYFCFQQQRAENCKKPSEKSAKINAESKKLSEPYQ